MADTGYNLQGTMSVSIEVDGQRLPPVGGILRSYYIQAGFGMSTPAATLMFSDRQNVLTGPLAINDGTKIKLYLGREGLSKVFNLRVLRKKAVDTPAGQEIEAICMLDVPAFALGAQSESARGTSVEAVRTLAERSGLKFETDVTANDSMTWLNVGKSRAAFVSDILRHSFVSKDTSLTGLLDVDNTFRVCDVFKRIQGAPEYTVFSGMTADHDTPKNKTFLASESAPSQVSGLTNAMLNYGTVRVDNMLGGKTDREKKINPPLIGDGLPINQGVRDSIEYTRMDYAKHYDPGVGKLAASNAHENYHTAPYRNDRYLALFSQGVYVMIDNEANIPLLACVDFQPYKQVGSETILDSSQAGKYIVGGVTLLGTGHYYSERYLLYRCYVSDSGNTPVLGSRNEQPSAGKPEATAGADSVVDYDDPLNAAAMSRQVNPSIKVQGDLDSQSSLDVKSKYEQAISSTQSEIDQMVESFKTESDSLNLDWLSEKYSSSSDKLDALMSEIGAAKQLLSFCKKPSWLESRSLEFGKLNAAGIFKMISSRIDKVEALQDSYMNKLNDLVASGEIKTSLLSPSLRTNCKAMNTDHINAAIADKFPDHCLDLNGADRLNGPAKFLNLLWRKLTESLRDIACLLEK